jgi:hypothetical protein
MSAFFVALHVDVEAHQCSDSPEGFESHKLDSVMFKKTIENTSPKRQRVNESQSVHSLAGASGL